MAPSVRPSKTFWAISKHWRANTGNRQEQLQKKAEVRLAPPLSAIGVTADKCERRPRVGPTARCTSDVTVRQIELLPLATGHAIVSCRAKSERRDETSDRSVRIADGQQAQERQSDPIRVAGGERYEAQLVARKFRVGLAVVLSVIKRVGNLRSRVYDELRRLTSKRRRAARKKFGG